MPSWTVCTRRDLEPYERGVFEAQRIELVRGWVKDIDAQARTLRLDSGRTLGWDRLLIATGSRPRRPQWEGLESVRTGQVHFVSMQDLEACEGAVRRGAKAVVVGGGLIGIELTECLQLGRHGSEFPDPGAVVLARGAVR